jgi:hypothetical protein
MKGFSTPQYTVKRGWPPSLHCHHWLPLPEGHSFTQATTWHCKTPTAAHQPPAPNVLGRLSADQKKSFLLEPYLAEKKQKEEIKL